MKAVRWLFAIVTLVLWISCTSSPVTAQPRDLDTKAKQILDATGVKGGRIDSTPTVYEGMVLFGCRDGSLVKSHSLSSPPAFDGLSAARGRLYLATLDCKVICFADAARRQAKL